MSGDFTRNCAGCDKPMLIDELLVNAQAGQLVELVHAGCQKRWRARVYGRAHMCPVCHGSGVVDDKGKPRYTNERDHDAEEADAYNGSMYGGHRYKRVISGYEKKPCEYCEGWGATVKELKPVIKTTEEIIGWK